MVRMVSWMVGGRRRSTMSLRGSRSKIDWPPNSPLTMLHIHLAYWTATWSCKPSSLRMPSNARRDDALTSSPATMLMATSPGRMRMTTKMIREAPTMVGMNRRSLRATYFCIASTRLRLRPIQGVA